MKLIKLLFYFIYICIFYSGPFIIWKILQYKIDNCDCTTKNIINNLSEMTTLKILIIIFYLVTLSIFIIQILLAIYGNIFILKLLLSLINILIIIIYIYILVYYDTKLVDLINEKSNCNCNLTNYYIIILSVLIVSNILFLLSGSGFF
jgi:uncharacterized Tic20 family protein